jgi:hypothetical protein
VHGRIELDDANVGRMPLVVVDRKEICWADFGTRPSRKPDTCMQTVSRTSKRSLQKASDPSRIEITAIPIVANRPIERPLLTPARCLVGDNFIALGASH